MDRTQIHEQNDSVSIVDIYLGEGRFKKGEWVYSENFGQAKALYRNDTCIFIRFEVSDTKKIFKEGIGVGSTVDKLIKVNNGHFEFTGFAWDYPGMINIWLNGFFSQGRNRVTMTIGYENNILQENIEHLLGDMRRNSKLLLPVKEKFYITSIEISEK